MTDKKIIITGGTGFIGSHLLTRILSHSPHKVRVLSTGSDPARIKQYQSQIELKTFHTPKQFVRLITNFKPDYIFILGGNSDPRLSVTNARLDLEFNLLYNFELLEKLQLQKNKAKIVYVSSIAVYGESQSPLHEELSPTLPKSPYGINKLATEGYVRFFAQQSGLKAISIRLAATYGPGLKKQVVYDFIKKLLTNPDELPILGDGTEVRDLAYIDDQIDGLLLISQKAKYVGEVYNLGSGKGITIAQLAQTIASTMKLQPKIKYLTNQQENHHGHNWILNIQSASSLGHQPKIDLSEGIQRTIEWIKNQ